MTNTHADARFWDRMARKCAVAPVKDMTGYEHTLERTRHHLRSTDTTLDLGCGRGTTALKLSQHVSCLFATDISSEMIAIARQKAAVQGYANVALEVAAADSASWPDGSFDAVLALNLLHLVAERRALPAHAATGCGDARASMPKSPQNPWQCCPNVAVHTPRHRQNASATRSTPVRKPSSDRMNRSADPSPMKNSP